MGATFATGATLTGAAVALVAAACGALDAGAAVAVELGPGAQPPRTKVAATSAEEETSHDTDVRGSGTWGVSRKRLRPR